MLSVKEEKEGYIMIARKIILFTTTISFVLLVYGGSVIAQETEPFREIAQETQQIPASINSFQNMSDQLKNAREKTSMAIGANDVASAHQALQQVLDILAGPQNGQKSEAGTGILGYLEQQTSENELSGKSERVRDGLLSSLHWIQTAVSQAKLGIASNSFATVTARANAVATDLKNADEGYEGKLGISQIAGLGPNPLYGP